MSIPLECPQDLYLIMRMCWQIKVKQQRKVAFSRLAYQSDFCLLLSIMYPLPTTSRLIFFFQPESRPTWSQLVDHLLSQYHNTLPGVYLDLPLASIPTPPSSVDTTACSDDDAVATVYKTITSVVSGKEFQFQKWRFSILLILCITGNG